MARPGKIERSVSDAYVQEVGNSDSHATHGIYHGGFGQVLRTFKISMNLSRTAISD
jgi:hypothetical protein